MYYMNYDYNKKFGLFKFQSDYREFDFNIQKLISAQTDVNSTDSSISVFDYFTAVIWTLKQIIEKGC